MLSSWISLAGGLTTYQSSLRDSRADKAPLKTSSGALYMLSKLCLLASLLLALALLAVTFRPPIFVGVVLFHYLLAALFIVRRGTAFCSSRARSPQELLFDLALAWVYIFDVVNIKEGRTGAFYAFCYSVYALENTAFAVAWFLRPQFSQAMIDAVARPIEFEVYTVTKGIVPRWALLLAVVAVFFLGIAVKVIYYKCAHPSLRQKREVGPVSNLVFSCEEVLWWLPLLQGSSCESVVRTILLFGRFVMVGGGMIGL